MRGLQLRSRVMQRLEIAPGPRTTGARVSQLLQSDALRRASRDIGSIERIRRGPHAHNSADGDTGGKGGGFIGDLHVSTRVLTGKQAVALPLPFTAALP